MHTPSTFLPLGLAFTLLGAAGCKKTEPTRPNAPAPAASPASPAPTPAPIAAPSPLPPPPAARPTAPNAAPTGAPADDGAALSFFRAQIEACNAWNVKVGNARPGEKSFDGTAKDPTRAMKVVGRPGPRQVLVQDADGTQLLVDLVRGRITSPKGPAAELPVRYRACPEKVFVGTSD